MNLVDIVYVKEAGVLGVVVHSYPDGAKRVYYLLDGLSVETDLDEEDFEVKIGEIN